MREELLLSCCTDEEPEILEMWINHPDSMWLVNNGEEILIYVCSLSSLYKVDSETVHGRTSAV